MGRGRHASYTDQRELILQRAAALFASRGYPGTSMNQVAEACGLSKATLYHYYRDKYTLLSGICESHMARLMAVVEEARAEGGPAPARMQALIRRLVEAYADAQNEHRVLTEDVKFLEPAERERIVAQERAVVRAFAEVVAELRPDLAATAMDKPLTMLLFGMVNWMFTWMKSGRSLDYDHMAPIVADLFLGGLAAVRDPRAAAAGPAQAGTPAPAAPAAAAAPTGPQGDSA